MMNESDERSREKSGDARSHHFPFRSARLFRSSRHSLHTRRRPGSTAEGRPEGNGTGPSRGASVTAWTTDVRSEWRTVGSDGARGRAGGNRGRVRSSHCHSTPGPITHLRPLRSLTAYACRSLRVLRRVMGWVGCDVSGERHGWDTEDTSRSRDERDAGRTEVTWGGSYRPSCLIPLSFRPAGAPLRGMNGNEERVRVKNEKREERLDERSEVEPNRSHPLRSSVRLPLVSLSRLVSSSPRPEGPAGRPPAYGGRGRGWREAVIKGYIISSVVLGSLS